MDTLIHADVFFFVTTIAVVVIGLLFVIALIYLIKILNNIKSIAEQVRDETVLFREDIHGLRASVREEGSKIKNMASSLIGTVISHFFSSWKSSRNRRKKK